MKLTDMTVEVLKNYSTINSNIVFTEGNTISTIAESRNILATSTVDMTFATKFGVYDLNEFLGVIDLVDEPQIKVEETHAVISDSTGRSKIKYFFTDPAMVTTPTESMLEKARGMNNFVVHFTMDRDTMAKIKRASSALKHKELSITASDGAIRLTVLDKENTTSNTFSIDVPGTYESEDFNFIYSIENLKVLPGDYEVGISTKQMSKWTNADKNMTYWLALDKTTTYGA